MKKESAQPFQLFSKRNKPITKGNPFSNKNTTFGSINNKSLDRSEANESSSILVDKSWG